MSLVQNFVAYGSRRKNESSDIDRVVERFRNVDLGGNVTDVDNAGAMYDNEGKRDPDMKSIYQKV